MLRRGAADDPQALDESLSSLEHETHRLGRMVSDLLVLAQADAGIPLRVAPVALDELILEVVRELHLLSGGAALSPQIAMQVMVDGDRDRHKQALINLVANALRADLARPDDGGGAGLGLAIVHWVAEAHHGVVSASSVEGQGSEFTLPAPPAPTSSGNWSLNVFTHSLLIAVEDFTYQLWRLRRHN
jgi:two-component system OmpR family sensor kinase